MIRVENAVLKKLGITKSSENYYFFTSFKIFSSKFTSICAHFSFINEVVIAIINIDIIC